MRSRWRASQLVQDGEIQQAVATRSMHRTELALSDGEGLAEASDRLVSHALLEVVHADQEVGVACFQAVLMVKLLDQLDVLDIARLALFLIADSVIERGDYAICL